jgi:hypothetical protein
VESLPPCDRAAPAGRSMDPTGAHGVTGRAERAAGRLGTPCEKTTPHFASTLGDTLEWCRVTLFTSTDHTVLREQREAASTNSTARAATWGTISVRATGCSRRVPRLSITRTPVARGHSACAAGGPKIQPGSSEHLPGRNPEGVHQSPLPEAIG